MLGLDHLSSPLRAAQEWETHRAPLVAKYRRAKQQLQERKSEVGAKVEQIKRMRVGESGSCCGVATDPPDVCVSSSWQK